MKKSIWVILILIVLAWSIFFFKSDIQDFFNTENENILIELEPTSISGNNFSTLNREIIWWPLTISECESMWWSITEDIYIWKSCEYKWLRYNNRDNEDNARYSLSGNNDHTISSIINNLWLWINNSNSLIEGFAILHDNNYLYETTKKVCLDDICLDPKENIYKYKDWLIQKIKFENEESWYWRSNTILVVINKNQNIAFKYNSDGMGGNYTYFLKNKNYTVLKTIEDMCTNRVLSQNISNEITDLPQSLEIFWQIYQLQKQNLTDDLWHSIPITFLENKYSINNTAAIEDDIINDIKDFWRIYDSYFVSFVEYPWIEFKYSSNFKQLPESVLYYTGDILTDENNNVIDLETTKEILCTTRHLTNQLETICSSEWSIDLRWHNDSIYFSEETYSTFDKKETEQEWNIKYSFNEKVLPIRKVEKTSEENFFYVYPSDNIEVWQTWVGCKPVVYVYDKSKQENTMSVILSKKSIFTKVIPDFSTNYSRDFKSDENSNIVIENEIYPYMYYSVLWADYQNNNKWRVVAYEDVEYFLNEKLNKMNFNQQEKADFLEYRLPEFEIWYNYFISFKYAEDLEQYAKLDFSIEPTKIFRMFMEARQIPLPSQTTYHKDKNNYFDQDLIQSFDRGGDFDVLERGWNLIKI